MFPIHKIESRKQNKHKRHFLLFIILSITIAKITITSTYTNTQKFTIQSSRMDQKRYTARRAEQMLTSKNLIFGIEGPHLDNQQSVALRITIVFEVRSLFLSNRYANKFR